MKALEGKEINLVCFTGDYQSPLAQAADTAFIIHDPQKFDDDIYWSNPFFGYCILGFERLLKMWFTRVRKMRGASGEFPDGGWRLIRLPGMQYLSGGGLRLT